MHLPMGGGSLTMTPANPKQRPGSLNSDTTRSKSIKNGLDFVNRLKKKDKDNDPSPAFNGQDEDESLKKRSKSLKTILSGMTS
jgi:hypothetical protein